MSLDKFELSIDSVFIPKSLSRNKLAKELSLNWHSTLYKAGKKVISHDYMQGIGRHPSYKPKITYELGQILKRSVESGRVSVYYANSDWYSNGKPLPKPKLEEFLSCLLSDAQVLDYPGFEMWATDLGYSTDSMQALATYQDCLQIALQLRYYLGQDTLTELQHLFKDY